MALGTKVDLPRSYGFLLMPGFSMLAFCSAIEPLRLANQLLGQRFYQWCVFTADGQPAKASCGMSIPADCGPEAVGVPQCVFVIAGFDPWPQEDKRLKNWLRSLDRRGVTLAAVDTGSFLLASAGLLGETVTALHWESAAAFSELFPEIPLSAALYEISERRFLCAGGAAVLDMMLEIIARTHGPGLRTAIAERLFYRPTRAGDRSQRVALQERLELSDSHVLQAISIMEANIEQPLSIGALCHALAVSKRTLERKFLHAVARTPKEYYLEVRLDHARKLLRHTDLKVREIALACGFSSMSYFSRAYKRTFSINPGKDRRLDYGLVTMGPGQTSAERTA
ncbi:MAG: GlxA family transcriptional regulator [Rhodospirillaceae bacterium]|nr:GlxA family transcriptional regulator [Rhodospirillaceae bacterium]